ncbi:MAG: hypothetical protein AAF561_12215 [Planctomycetota bacterium]
MDLQQMCEVGQRALVETDYLRAEALLVEAEAVALESGDFDTLGRLYFPLQEARRQRRQVCGEGTVRLDLWGDEADPDAIVERYPAGQLLVAGTADLGPALRVRELAKERGLYVETYLAAAYPMTDDGRVIVAIVPTADVELPPADTALATGPAGLLRRLPPFSLVVADDELPRGEQTGSADTFAQTMHLWEELHLPFLTAARETRDPERRIEAYRRCIAVDYACEKAHQWLADTALSVARGARS